MDEVFSQDADASLIWEGFLADNVRPLGSEELDRFTNKRILITGGGGYLGSALARAFAALPIADLVLLDHSEYGLYKLDQDFRDTGQTPPASLIVGSVVDRVLLDEIFTKHAPEIVFHTAALKHVPLMQANAFAAAETNALGTHTLVEAAERSRVSRFVFLSTDKAVDPISIMGATKKIGEQIVLRARDHDPDRFVAFRLCNVLGSTGSVAPTFASQIAAGLPLTLAHAEATRFFISRTDAVRYLLRAAIMPSETGLLIPRLREAHRVQDLAAFLLQRTGCARQGRMVETGLRSGDKLHEQLISSSEHAQPSLDHEMLAIHSRFDRGDLGDALTAIQNAVSSRDPLHLFQAIRSVVPSYGDEDAASKLFNEAIA